MSRYQKGKTNLDFTEARDSEWQWHLLGHMQVYTLLQTDNHASTSPLSFFTGRTPFLPPNQQRQSTEGTWRIRLIYRDGTTYKLTHQGATPDGGEVCHLLRLQRLLPSCFWTMTDCMLMTWTSLISRSQTFMRSSRSSKPSYVVSVGCGTKSIMPAA